MHRAASVIMAIKNEHKVQHVTSIVGRTLYLLLLMFSQNTVCSLLCFDFFAQFAFCFAIIKSSNTCHLFISAELYTRLMWYQMLVSQHFRRVWVNKRSTWLKPALPSMHQCFGFGYTHTHILYIHSWGGGICFYLSGHN